MTATSRDYYELLGVEPQRLRVRSQARVPSQGARAPPRRQRRTGRGGTLPRGGGGVRGALEVGDARALRPLRSRRPPGRRLPGRPTSISASATSSPPSATTCSSPGRARGLACRVEWRSSSSTPRPACTDLVDVVVGCGGCGRDGAGRGRVVDCDGCGGTGRIQQVGRSVFGEFVRAQPCPRCSGAGRTIEQPCEDCEGSGRVVERRTLAVEIPPGIHDGQRIGSRARATSAARGARRRRLRPRARQAGRPFRPRGRRRLFDARPDDRGGGARDDANGRDPERRVGADVPGGHTARRGARALGRGMPCSRATGAANTGCSSTSSSRATSRRNSGSCSRSSSAARAPRTTGRTKASSTS